MCEASVLVKHRVAREREELVVRKVPSHFIFGMYPVDGGTLVCVLPGTEVVIEKVPFITANHKLNNKEHVKAKFIQADVWSRYGDRLQIGRFKVRLGYLEGARINIGVPFERDLEKSLKLDNIDVDIKHEVTDEEVSRQIREHVE